MAQLQRYPTRFFQDFQEKLDVPHIEKWLKQVDDKMSQAKNPTDWENAILFWNEIKCHIDTHANQISLAFYRNTQDEKNVAEEERLHQEIEPPYKKLNAPLREKILKSPFRKDLEQKLGSQYFLQLQIQQDAFHSANVELDAKVNQKISEYTKLTGSGEFEVEGKKYPLPHYKKFLSDERPSIRKESLQSYSNWFLKNRDPLEEIYEECTQLRDKMGKNLGHDDYIPLAYMHMRRVDYGPREVEAFRKQILEVIVPISKKIRQAQCKMLGTSSVSIWNNDFFPEWRASKLKVDIHEQVPAALKAFQGIDPKLGKHFQDSIHYDLIDVPSRPGKAPGAFCTDFPDYRVPYIFLNSVGEGSDITTILHESGHSFQAWESRSIDLLELRWPTLEACEVHSMSMEFLAYPHYDLFFEHTEAERFKKYHLAESLLLLPYIAVVDEFQHQVYEGSAKGASGRAKAWKELEKKYIPDLDFSDAPFWQEIRWLRQLHIFHNPFYYIDYAIALVGALQIWVQSVQNKKQGLENYLHLCQLGGSLPLQDFFKAGNLKLPFETGMLKDLMDQVLKIEALV